MPTDSLGDRMKENYENRGRHMLVRRMPVIIRVDGRAFHTFTRGFNRPFDHKIINAMVDGARAVCEEAQGCKLAYIQSDEASFLLTDYDDLATDAWFGYVKSKVETIAASVMTAAFNVCLGPMMDHFLPRAHFDARSFNIPREEVANYFLWRARDWERNSLAMYCGSFFSHKQMHEKGKADKHEMLHGIGKNWATDLSPTERNGTWLAKGGGGWIARSDIEPHFASIDAITEPLVNCDEEPTDQASVDTSVSAFGREVASPSP